jgi:lactate racemase
MNDIKIAIPYGKQSIIARIPTVNLSDVLAAKELRGLENEKKAIVDSLRSPIGMPALSECVKKGDKVVIIVTDNTRACPDDRLLPPILDELEETVAREDITIIVALGLHAPLDESTLAGKLGQYITGNYCVLNHDPAGTVNIGVTSRGTPVEINSRVVEADFRLSTGYIEPHFFAGFSGGRKSIAPGVSSSRSIKKNHGYEMIGHELAVAGVLRGNPVHEDMVEQAKMANLNFIVNVLLNKRQEITHIVAGHFEQAHLSGCEIEREICQVAVDYKVDICITSNSGSPLDLDFYQTCKGIDTASKITRDGGVIIAVSSCSSGVGPGAFERLHNACRRPSEVLDLISTSSSPEAWWQNQILARAQLKHKIFLVSDLDNSSVQRMLVNPVETVEEGIAEALKELGNNAEIAVIPEGPLVLPVVKTRPLF